MGPSTYRLIVAMLVVLIMLPKAGMAQDPAASACSAANLQRTDELVQALTAARSKRNSLSLQLKLLPIEAQLKVLQVAQQLAPRTTAECQRVAAQIDAERDRLMRIIPDLQLVPSASGVVATAVTVAPAQLTALPVPIGNACSADNEQRRADLVQRFANFMQMARLPPNGLALHQGFGRRLTELGSNMAANPADCGTHGAALAQSNAELQQLMALESRNPSPGAPDTVGDRSLEGTMPLAANASNESCVADLRRGYRDVQQEATRLMMTMPESVGRARAQQVLQGALQQQVDAFGRGVLQPDACEQLRRSVEELRSAASAARQGGASETYLQSAQPGSASPQPVVRQVPQPGATPPPQPAPATADRGSELADCMTTNVKLYNELERESNQLKASGRQSPVPDRELAQYRDGLRTPIAVYCGVLNQNLNIRLSQVRSVAAAPPPPTVAQQAPTTQPGAGSPPPVVSSPVAAPVPPPSNQARPAAPPPRPAAAEPAREAAPPAKRAQAPAPAASAPKAAPPPAQSQRQRAEPSQAK